MILALLTALLILALLAGCLLWFCIETREEQTARQHQWEMDQKLRQKWEAQTRFENDLALREHWEVKDAQ